MVLTQVTNKELLWGVKHALLTSEIQIISRKKRLMAGQEQALKQDLPAQVEEENFSTHVGGKATRGWEQKVSYFQLPC